MSEDTKKARTTRGTQTSGSEPLSSVLVPIDLTPGSDRVLGRLALLPLARDASVTLLHVVPGGVPAQDQSKAERDASRALAEELRHLRKSLPRGVHLEPLVKVGGVAKHIATCAAKAKAELIVMGRGGGRALRDTFLGSTAERVIREARLPVLVARLPARAAYHRPALALDLDEAAHDAVGLMLRVLPPPRPHVTVIHAVDTPYPSRAYPSLATDEADYRDELLLRTTQKLRKLLAAALERAKVAPGDAPPFSTQVKLGSPRLVVEKALRKVEPDLLVLGTHGYAGAAYVFLGTVAGDLLREAKCDALVVPPRQRR